MSEKYRMTVETTAGGDGHGFASGWQVYEHNGRWHWSAYGPNGGTHSTAPSRQEAERRAQAAERDLRRPLAS